MAGKWELQWYDVCVMYVDFTKPVPKSAGPDASCYSMSVGRRLEVGRRETSDRFGMLWIPGAVGVTGRFLDGIPCMVNVFSAVYHRRKCSSCCV